MDDLPTNDQEFEEFEIAEDELIDAYVRDELSADERKLIEKGLLNSPRLVERVHFAKMLAKAALDSKTPVMQPNPEPIKPPWWKLFMGFVELPAFRTALVACVIIVLVGGVLLLVGWMKLRSESQRIASERTALEKERQELERQSASLQSSNSQLNSELQAARHQRERDQKLIEELTQTQRRNEQSQPSTFSTIATALLFAGSTRGTGGSNEVVISPDTSTINLKLVLESNEYRSYKATIKNAQNVSIQRDRLKPRRSRSGQILSIRIRANLLTPGDHIVDLSGVTSSGAVEPVSNYQFRIRN